MIILLRLIAFILVVWFLAQIDSSTVISISEYEISLHTVLFFSFIIFCFYLLLKFQSMTLKKFYRAKNNSKKKNEDVTTTKNKNNNEKQDIKTPLKFDLLSLLSNNSKIDEFLLIENLSKIEEKLLAEHKKFQENKEIDFNIYTDFFSVYKNHNSALIFIISVLLKNNDIENIGKNLSLLKKTFQDNLDEYNKICSEIYLYLAFKAKEEGKLVDLNLVSKSFHYYVSYWNIILLQKLSSKKIITKAFLSKLESPHISLFYLYIDTHNEVDKKIIDEITANNNDEVFNLLLKIDVSFAEIIKSKGPQKEQSSQSLQKEIDKLLVDINILKALYPLISHSLFLANYYIEKRSDLLNARNILRQSAFDIYKIVNLFDLDENEWVNNITKYKDVTNYSNGSFLFPVSYNLSDKQLLKEEDNKKYQILEKSSHYL